MIARLIFEASTQTTAATPISKKTLAKKKKTIVRKKKKATSKKKASTRKKTPTVEADALGLERPIGYEDWEAAVSIEIETERLNLAGEHAEWWPVGMIRHSYIWDGEAELVMFKKKHAAATIVTSYPRDHKRTVEFRACYGEGESDYRLTLSALPAKKKT